MVLCYLYLSPHHMSPSFYRFLSLSYSFIYVPPLHVAITKERRKYVVWSAYLHDKPLYMYYVFFCALLPSLLLLTHVLPATGP